MHTQLEYTPILCTCFPFNIFNYKDIVDIINQQIHFPRRVTKQL